jgi:transmembrane sensor
MGNFECNSMEDLVFSRSFRNWVFNRDSPEAGFWENWIARNPDKQGLVDHAKAVIYALQLNPSAAGGSQQAMPARLSDEDIETEVRKALQRLKEGRRPDDAPARRTTLFPRRTARILAMAALFSGACLTGYFIHRLSSRKHRDVLQYFLASHKNDPVQQETGNTPASQIISLPDGSRVRLGKGSKLYYPNLLQNTNGRREVYLDGEAFFDINKNAGHPFYVYTGQVITKVLGTSFFVRANASDPTTTVTVKTGKVSVYREDDFYADVTGGSASGASDPGGIILTPNQEVIYNRGQRQLKKTISDRPERLAELQDSGLARTRDTTLVFNGTPVSRVFKRLQELYGIPIVYDEEAVSSCSLLATMGNESFYDKLNIICKAINGSYEEIDGNIVVTAPGCK